MNQTEFETLIVDESKHRWNEVLRDKEAYVPQDITFPATNPVEVWKQFCLEARITHNGKMSAPLPIETEFL